MTRPSTLTALVEAGFLQRKPPDVRRVVSWLARSRQDLEARADRVWAIVCDVVYLTILSPHRRAGHIGSKDCDILITWLDPSPSATCPAI